MRPRAGHGRRPHARRFAGTPGRDLVAGLQGDARCLGGTDRAAGELPHADGRLCRTPGRPACRHRGRCRRHPGLRHPPERRRPRGAAPGIPRAARAHLPVGDGSWPRHGPACRRKRRSGRQGADRDRPYGGAAGLQGPPAMRPLLFARHAARRIRDRDAARRRPGRHRHRQPADVQHVPAGPHQRAHAALARHHLAARAARRGHSRVDRLGQLPRPVLCLRRSRHARGHDPGHAHRPSRPSVRRLADVVHVRAGRRHGPCRARPPEGGRAGRSGAAVGPLHVGDAVAQPGRPRRAARRPGHRHVPARLSRARRALGAPA